MSFIASQSPTVSIGLPVYNGQDFLEQALNSIVSQTYKSIEIIISDNCSTDNTSSICKKFTESDNRIRYYRQSRNLGAGPNYNFVFNKSNGKYFKWAAHDDYLDANALELCIEILEKDKDVVLAYAIPVDVDFEGRILKNCKRATPYNQPVHERFWTMIGGGHNCTEIFGVIRSSVLRKTKLIRSYTDSDRTLLGELALLGKIVQLDRSFFYRRVHPSKSDKIYSSYFKRAEWFNAKNIDKITLSAWQQLWNWVYAIAVYPLSFGDKIKCMYKLAKMTKWRWQLYTGELQWALNRLLNGSS
jgi:glycosyltransferase involved in cell wall biosynthesis